MFNTFRGRLAKGIGLASVGVVLLTACGSSESSTPSSSSTQAASGSSGTVSGTTPSGLDLSGVTLTMGQQGGETEAIFQASGAFADTPYKVEFATFPSPTDTLTALANGQVDIANNLSQWTATQAAAAASPAWTADTAPYKNILVYAPGDPINYDRFVVVASAASGITDINDTKGKNWGFLPGSSTNLMAAKLLQTQGWTFDDVKTVSLDSTNQVLALQTGDVDVLFNPRDNVVAAIQQGAKVLAGSHEFGLTIYTGFLANEKSLNDPAKGAALEDLASRIIKSQDWYNQNPQAAQDALVKFRKVTPEQAKTIWEYTRVLPSAPSAEISTYSQGLADTAVTFGLLKNKLDATVLLDERFSTSINKTLTDIDYATHLKASYAGS